MIRLRFKITLAVAMIVGVLVWISGYRHGASRPPSGPNPATVLPSNESERITVDPEKHTLIIQTPMKVKVVTLPYNKSTIDVFKNGEVKVTSSQFGLEHHVFMGYGLSDTGRFVIGLDGLYYKRLDLGLGFGSQFGNHSPIAFAKLSYTVYGNIQAGIIYGSNQSIGAIVSVRLF